MTAEPRAHPFVPVVRWTIFPVTSGLAGMLGGMLLWAAGWYPDNLLELALCCGLLSLGGAAGLCLTSRGWLAVALTPVLLLAVLVGAVPFYYSVFYPALGITPASHLREMLANPIFQAPLLLHSIGQTCGHVLAIRWGGRPFRRTLIYGTAGLAAGALVWLLDREWGRCGIVLLTTLLQAPAMEAALAVSARLRRT